MRREITDISTLFGVLSAIGMICAAVYMGADGAGGMDGFLDAKSVFIVLGGTFFLVVACFSLSDVFKAIGAVAHTIFYYAESQKEAALISLELASIARKKGLLELQKHDSLLKSNPFWEKGVKLIIDGVSPEDAEKILRKEIDAVLQRHQTSTRVLHKAADIAPAMGLIGTLIGLVLMLGNLSDPESIGPAMAVALLTTLYGAVFSYMILTPLATKLERNTRAEAKIMYIYLNSIISIGNKENPRRLEMLINATLPPSQRVEYFG